VRRRTRGARRARITPVTWLLLGLLVVASASTAIYSARRLARGSAPPPQVQVLNGSGVAEMGQRAADTLRRRGLDVVAVGNADAADYAETLVLVRRGHPGVAHEVAQALGRGRVLEQRDASLRVDVTIILGQDYAGPAATRGDRPGEDARGEHR
jgi:hypothetical protein